MQILPVLDIMNGQVVRGVAGRRDEYRPIVSRLTSSTDPVSVGQALRFRFGFEELYVADLDAIVGGTPALAVLEALHKERFRLWVDAGVRDVEDSRQLFNAGVMTVIAGLETLAGPAALERLCLEHDSERIVFSLDLKAGRALRKNGAWSSDDPEEIARHAVHVGVNRILILDLARVGMGEGTDTDELCRRIHRAHPEVRLATGGGIRDMADVQKLVAAGVDTVLIASALHDGRIAQL